MTHGGVVLAAAAAQQSAALKWSACFRKEVTGGGGGFGQRSLCSSDKVHQEGSCFSLLLASTPFIFFSPHSFSVLDVF